MFPELYRAGVSEVLSVPALCDFTGEDYRLISEVLELCAIYSDNREERAVLGGWEGRCQDK